MPERVTFKTYDGVNIVGDWNPVPTTIGVAVMLHMMPTDRRSWAPFQQVLAKSGIASLAIDLRGHGESVKVDEGGNLDFNNFTDEQHQQSVTDVLAAVDWLLAKKYMPDRLMLVGASIGASLALSAIQDLPNIHGLILLSPGNYRGMNAEDDAMYVKAHQALWAAGSDGDDTESFEVARKIVETATASRKMFIPYKNAGHGIQLFTSDPKLMESLAAWMKESFQKPF